MVMDFFQHETEGATNLQVRLSLDLILKIREQNIIAARFRWALALKVGSFFF